MLLMMQSPRLLFTSPWQPDRSNRLCFQSGEPSCACAQAKRENDSVYYQHVPPADALPPVQPRRLTNMTPYGLPAPAPLVTDALQAAFTEVPPDKVMPRRERSCADSGAAAAGRC